MKSISIVWTTDDMPDALNETQKEALLMTLLDNHDANIGINWDVIDTTMADMFRAGVFATKEATQ